MKQELITLEDFDFILVPSKVKNINLRILHNGTVRVSAPQGMDKAEILHFVECKKNWILKHREKFYLKDDEFLFLGEKRKLSDLKNTPLADFYSEEAGKILKERYDKLADKLTIYPPRLIIKPLKGKYGYYTKGKHEICLNSRLIMVPVDCIDFVIIHELMHTIYFNHGKNFHKAMKEILPDEKELREKLSKYILW